MSEKDPVDCTKDCEMEGHSHEDCNTNVRALESPSEESFTSNSTTPTPSPDKLVVPPDTPIENIETGALNDRENSPIPSANDMTKRRASGYESHDTAAARPATERMASSVSLEGADDENEENEENTTPSAETLCKQRTFSNDSTAASERSLLSMEMDGANEREEVLVPSAKALGKRKAAVTFEESMKPNEHATTRGYALSRSDNRSIEDEYFGASLTRHTHRSRPHPTLGGRNTKKSVRKPWKTSRLWPAHVCVPEKEHRYKKDAEIPHHPHTPAKQAEKPGKFIGDAFRYRLTNPANREALEGSYTVVYTRPVGKRFDINDRRCAIFTPGSTRSVDVYTHVPEPGSSVAEDMRQMLDPAGGGIGRDLGVCWFRFDRTPVRFAMLLHHADVHDQNQTSHKTTFRTEHVNEEQSTSGFNWDKDPEYVKHRDLIRILSENLNHDGHTISFGIVDLDQDRERGKRGFYFMEMEFSCMNPRTGGLDRQLVIAVRIPDRPKSISNLFMLKQPFTSLHSLEILNGDPTQLAAYEQYDDDPYPFNNPPAEWPRWSPNYISDVGLGDRRFSATEVERYLFYTNDPITKLEKLHSFLRREAEASAHRSNIEHSLITEAFAYVCNRYKNFKGEHLLIEEYCGAYQESIEDEEDDLAAILDKIDEAENREVGLQEQRSKWDSSGFSEEDFRKDEDMSDTLMEIKDLEREEKESKSGKEESMRRKSGLH